MNEELNAVLNELDDAEGAVRAIGSLALNDANTGSACNMLLVDDFHCLMAVISKDIGRTRERLEKMLAGLP